jgi:hypothetical protein
MEKSVPMLILILVFQSFDTGSMDPGGPILVASGV